MNNSMFNEQAKQSFMVKSLLRRRILEYLIVGKLFLLALRLFRSPIKAVSSVWQLHRKLQSVFPKKMQKRAAKINGKYFWYLYLPGFPSPVFQKTFKQILTNQTEKIPQAGILMLAITNKCPLSCEHCFEWENLNQKESIQTDDWTQIVQKAVNNHVSQLFFCGGEPLNQFQRLLSLIKTAGDQAETWIITSGYRLTKEKAVLLKQSGLTGILVSLDDHRPSEHNSFRGNDNAYSWAIQAIKNAQEVGLVTGLSLCPTNTFVTASNLQDYMEFAKHIGVVFIQILEPKAVGRYTNKEVALAPEQIELLTSFFLEFTTGTSYSNYPILHYEDYISRLRGCAGKSRHQLYVDTKGFAHPCPFCKSSDAPEYLDTDVPDISLLQCNSCQSNINSPSNPIEYAQLISNT